MATLALLDLTFRPKETSVRRTQDRNLAISSKSPAIIFHSSTKVQSTNPLDLSNLKIWITRLNPPFFVTPIGDARAPIDRICLGDPTVLLAAGSYRI
jgi:hypothetical protein